VLAGADGLRQGAYVLAEASGGAPELIIIASGTEVGLALEARETLESQGRPTRVVSMPSWRLFEDQAPEYHAEVLVPGVPRISVEAGTTMGWHRWIGADGIAIGVDHFGASAPAERLYEEFGITANAVVEAGTSLG
jgi:transketolase